MSDYIPEEILQEILLKLPVKSLIRCTAVCKSWRSLIKSSTFVKNHLSHTIQSNHQNDVHTLLLHKKVREGFYSVNWDNPTFGEHINVANPFVDNNSALKKRDVWPWVVGTYNGLVCLAYHDTSDPIIVCNPSIRKYVILPEAKPTLMDWVRLEFGYDSRNDDYKVLRIRSRSRSHQSDDCEIDVWSLSRGSWKTLKAKLKKSVPSGNTTLVKGALHRVHNYLKRSADYFILCFDMVSELFEEIIMPQDLRKNCCSTIRYGESIGLLSHVRRNAGDSVFQVWVMKEYGVVESWTKQFDICLQGVVLDDRLCAFKSSEEILLREFIRGGTTLLSVDLKSKHVKQFGIDGYQAFDSFVESLILLGQANACSYKD